MSHFRMLICCVAPLILMCACAKKPPRDNYAEDEWRVSELEAKFSEAIAAKDLDALVSLYSDDAALYDEHNPGIRGKNAIREAWKAEFVRFGLAMSTRPHGVEISSDGNLAWAHGGFTMTTHDAAGRPATEHWEYALVYTKQPDGKWKILADSVHSGLRNHLFKKPPKSSSPLAPFAPLIGLACLGCLLWFLFGMPIVAIAAAWKFYRSRRASTGILVSFAMLIGFFLAAALLWNHFAAHYWNLSLVRTFQAAGDTARYGNPVEDTAEAVLVSLLITSTLSALAAGLITGVARWMWIRRRRPAA